MSTINGSGLGVSTVYDSDIDRFFIQTSDTGEDSWFRVSETGNFMTGAGNLLNLNLTRDSSYVEGTEGISDGTNNIYLAEQFTEVTDADGMYFTIKTHNNPSGQYIAIENMASKTMTDVVNEINSHNLGVTASYDSATDKFSIAIDDEGGYFSIDENGLKKYLTTTDSVFQTDLIENVKAQSTITSTAAISTGSREPLLIDQFDVIKTGDTIDFTITSGADGQAGTAYNFSYAADTTRLSDMIDDINNTAGIKVKASYDSTNDKFIITAADDSALGDWFKVEDTSSIDGGTKNS